MRSTYHLISSFLSVRRPCDISMPAPETGDPDRSPPNWDHCRDSRIVCFDLCSTSCLHLQNARTQPCCTIPPPPPPPPPYTAHCLVMFMDAACFSSCYSPLVMHTSMQLCASIRAPCPLSVYLQNARAAMSHPPYAASHACYMDIDDQRTVAGWYKQCIACAAMSYPLR